MKKNEISFRESANVNLTSVNYEQEFAGVNYGKLTKAFRDVLMEFRKFKACVKTLDTLPTITVTVGDKEMTHKELLSKIGVKFDKNGRIDVESIKAIWSMRSEDGYMKVYRSVTGTIMREGDKPEKVYRWNADKHEYQTVRIYAPVIVEKWNLDTLLKGLAQIVTIKEQEKRLEKTMQEWSAVKDVYVFDKQTNKGGVTNKARKVSKDNVVF